MTSHFTGTTKKKQKMESRKAASEEVRLQTTAKTGSEDADVTCGGRPFQMRAAATGKARSPMVDTRVRRTTNDDDEADRRRRRASKSAGWHSILRRGTMALSAVC